MEDQDYEAQEQRREHEYETLAQRFLDNNHLILRATFKGDKCPSWCDGTKHIHGDRYRVTIKRDGTGAIPLTNSISFDFWNSLNDAQEGKKPTAYTVLACISSDVSMPTDPDEVVQELGEMKPSQAIATAKFAKRLQGFFRDKEIEELSEIQ